MGGGGGEGTWRVCVTLDDLQQLVRDATKWAPWKSCSCVQHETTAVAVWCEECQGKYHAYQDAIKHGEGIFHAIAAALKRKNSAVRRWQFLSGAEFYADDAARIEGYFQRHGPWRRVAEAVKQFHAEIESRRRDK